MFCIHDWSDGFSEHGGFPFIGDHDEGSDLHRRCCGARFVGLVIPTLRPRSKGAVGATLPVGRATPVEAAALAVLAARAVALEVLGIPAVALTVRVIPVLVASATLASGGGPAIPAALEVLVHPGGWRGGPGHPDGWGRGPGRRYGYGWGYRGYGWGRGYPGYGAYAGAGYGYYGYPYRCFVLDMDGIRVLTITMVISP